MTTPTKTPVTITVKAAQYIQDKLASSTNAAALRISLKKGGCSGQEYHFEFASEQQPHDEVMTDQGITVYIDPAAFLNVLGSTMDYNDSDPFAAGLVFINPNETDRCGCGKSVRFDISPNNSTSSSRNEDHHAN